MFTMSGGRYTLTYHLNLKFVSLGRYEQTRDQRWQHQDVSQSAIQVIKNKQTHKQTEYQINNTTNKHQIGKDLPSEESSSTQRVHNIDLWNINYIVFYPSNGSRT